VQRPINDKIDIVNCLTLADDEVLRQVDLTFEGQTKLAHEVIAV
jgi:hypothetical protein